MANVKVEWNPKNAVELINAKAAKRLIAAGFLLEGTIKRMFKEGSGKTYKKGIKGDILHTASAPGQAPAVDTGRLRASITTNWSGGPARQEVKTPTKTTQKDDGIGNPGGESSWDKFLFKVSVGTNVKYAPLLEFGTSKMAARPFMRPANEIVKDKIARLLAVEE